MSAAVIVENHKCSVESETLTMDARTKFVKDVVRGGLSFPHSIGCSEAIAPTWQAAMTLSCHIYLYSLGSTRSQ